MSQRQPSDLRRELRDLTLVAAGAIPGALLRWQLAGLGGADLVANLCGCLLLGVLLARPAGSERLYLLGGIGFCGSLTTFSSWMLNLVTDLQRDQPGEALAALALQLLGGLALLQLGFAAGQRWRRRGRR